MPILPGDSTLVTTQAPVEPVESRFGLRHEWIGWDDSVWNLSAWWEGVFLFRPSSGGIRGLFSPDHATHASSSPALHGSRVRSTRVEPREVFWPLFVHHDGSSLDWLARDRAFWRTMHRDRPGTWRVTTPDGQRRTLSCSFVSDGAAWELDPIMVGWQKYGVSMLAHQPFWQGEPVERVWQYDATQALDFHGDGTDYVVYISPGSALGEASIPNPGEEPAYLDWSLTGPFASATVRGIGVPAVAAGETLVIRTAPEHQTAINLAGTDRTGELGAVDFSPVPAGETADLSVALTGAGPGWRVQASLVPLFSRAF